MHTRFADWWNQVHSARRWLILGRGKPVQEGRCANRSGPRESCQGSWQVRCNRRVGSRSPSHCSTSFAPRTGVVTCHGGAAVPEPTARREGLVPSASGRAWGRQHVTPHQIRGLDRRKERGRRNLGAHLFSAIVTRGVQPCPICSRSFTNRPRTRAEKPRFPNVLANSVDDSPTAKNRTLWGLALCV